MQESALQSILCAMGHPATGCPLQIAMERGLAEAGLDWRYLTLEVSPEHLLTAIRGAAVMGFRGIHLLPTLSGAVARHLDRLDGAAAQSQWVDCIRIEAGELVGRCLLGETVAAAVGPASGELSTAVLLGEGPPNHALAMELAGQGWGPIFCETLPEPPCIDATSTDATPAASPVPSAAGGASIQSLGSRKRWPADLGLVILGQNAKRAASDAVRQRLESFAATMQLVDLSSPTNFSSITRAADQRGLKTISGLEMLVRYTAATFHWWTQQEPSHSVLREAFEEYYEI